MLYAATDTASDRRVLIDASLTDVARELGYRYTRSIMTTPVKNVVHDSDPFARLM